MTQTTELAHAGVKIVTVNIVPVIKTETSCQKETENIKTPKQHIWNKTTEVAVNMSQAGLGIEHTPQNTWLSKSTCPTQTEGARTEMNATMKTGNKDWH